MKRSLALLLCVIMMFSVLAAGVSAADTVTVHVKSGSQRSVAVGESFTYSYAIRINGTYDLDRVWLDVLYDDECLKLDKVEYPTFGSATETDRNGDLHIEKGVITNASQYNSGITTIVTCTFQVLRAGTTWIRTLPQRIEVEAGSDSDHYLIDNYRQYNAVRGALFSSYDYLGTAAPNNASSSLSNTKDVVWFYVNDGSGEHIGAGQSFKLSGTDANGNAKEYTAITDAYGYISFGVVDFGTYFLSCTSTLPDGSAYCIDNPNIAVPNLEGNKLVVQKTISVRALGTDEMRSVVIKTNWTNEEIEKDVPYTEDRPGSVYLELSAGGKVYAQAYVDPSASGVTFDRLPLKDSAGNTISYELNTSPVPHYSTNVTKTESGVNVEFRFLNDHNWTRERTEPTCDKNGAVVYTCSDCGKVYTYTLSSLGHDFDESGRPATCTEDGSRLFVCKRCNKWYTETVKAKGHTWSTWTTDVPATENTDGRRSHYCTVCGATETQLIHKLSAPDAHVYETKVVEPTCTEGGYTMKVCACGDTIIVDGTRTPALGHSYEGDSTTRTVFENSCTEDGLIEYTCSRCGEVHVEALKATGHNYGTTDQKEPTCTESGYKNTKCAYCGDVRNIRMPALGHAWGDWIVDVEPTATTNGSRHRVCTRCLQEEVGVIPYSGEGHVHTYTERKDVAPTCSERGYTVYICPADGAEFIDNDSYVDALGHAWDEQWRTESTTRTRGVIAYQCARCNEFRYEYMPKAAGSWTNPFWDVSSSDWFFDNVRYVSYNEYMNGTSASRFDPNASMTRAMLVTVLYRMVGEPAVTGLDNPFRDVASGTWYSNAVTWAYVNGVVNGVSGTEFAPDLTITREQMVTIFFRYANYASYDTASRKGLSDFSDAGQVSAYAQEAFSWAVSVGIINGFVDGNVRTLQPQGTATRAQAAKIIQTFDNWRINL